jgi:hypothetical protein
MPCRQPRDERAYARARQDADGVEIGAVLALTVLELHPRAVQVDQLRHHGAVDEAEAEPLTDRHVDRAHFGELLAVEAPDEPLMLPVSVSTISPPGGCLSMQW